MFRPIEIYWYCSKWIPCLYILPKRNTNVIGRNSIHYTIYLPKGFKIKDLIFFLISFYIPFLRPIDSNKPGISHYIPHELAYYKFRSKSYIKFISSRIFECCIIYIPLKFPVRFRYASVRIFVYHILELLGSIRPELFNAIFRSVL